MLRIVCTLLYANGSTGERRIGIYRARIYRRRGRGEYWNIDHAEHIATVRLERGDARTYRDLCAPHASTLAPVWERL